MIIYANSILLGAEAIIGARSIIGGNVWVTERLASDTKVLLKRPKLVYIGNNNKKGNPIGSNEVPVRPLWNQKAEIQILS